MLVGYVCTGYVYEHMSLFSCTCCGLLLIKGFLQRLVMNYFFKCGLLCDVMLRTFLMKVILTETLLLINN